MLPRGWCFSLIRDRFPVGFDAKNGTAGGAGRRPGDAREGSGTSLEGGFRKSLKKTPESDAQGSTI